MCGRYTLTADLKKVAGEHLNAQHSTRNTQHSSQRGGDSDEDAVRLNAKGGGGVGTHRPTNGADWRLGQFSDWMALKNGQ